MDEGQGLAQLAGKPTLAGTGQATGEEQSWPPLAAAGIGRGQGQVAGTGLVIGGVFLRRQLPLPQADGQDLGPHQGAVDLVQVQDLEGAIVPALPQVGVEQPTGQGPLPRLFQVHEQKGQFAGGVDPAQLGGELQGIEEQGLPLDQGDVAAMQVTMAFPHPACRPPLFNDRGQRLPAGPGPVLQPVQPGLALRPQGADTDLAEILQHGRQDRRRGAVGAVRRGWWQAVVEGGQPRGEAVDQIRGEDAVVEPVPLVETAHLHHIFQDGAGAAELRLLRGAGDRHQPQIEFGGKAAVEAQLLLAKVVTTLGGREVKETQVHRLLELISPIASEKDVGDVGLQVLDHPVGANQPQWVGLGPAQAGNQAREIPFGLIGRIPCDLSGGVDHRTVSSGGRGVGLSPLPVGGARGRNTQREVHLSEGLQIRNPVAPCNKSALFRPLTWVTPALAGQLHNRLISLIARFSGHVFGLRELPT